MSAPGAGAQLPNHFGDSQSNWLWLYRCMQTSRQIDHEQQLIVSSGQAFFHVSGAGHESTALLAPALSDNDWLHLHYRDKALMVARGLSIAEFFRGLVGSSGGASMGRQLAGFHASRDIRLPGMVVPVGNHALHACGTASVLKQDCKDGLVVCSVGDGTTQEGEFLEAIAESVRWQLPVLFVIADNGYSISTPTDQKTFFDLPSGPAESFYGVKIVRVNGRDVVAAAPSAHRVANQVRKQQGPGLLLLHVDRLHDHTNADDQSQYRSPNEVAGIVRSGDPVLQLRIHLLRSGIPEQKLNNIDRDIKLEVQDAAADVLKEGRPETSRSAVALYPRDFADRPEYRGGDDSPRYTMRKAISEVLNHLLSTDPRVYLYGQDIEDPKGDVFGVTRGLSTAFPSRVVNAPLSESTIVGTAVGRALAGQRPIAFIQFADFLPLAFNQILSEMASTHWRTNGQWECPVILMVTCGGYRPGLGPFHSQTMDGFSAHIPGVDVVMPSSAADAAGLLNAAFESPRPTIFLYPKSCLNLESRSTSADVRVQFVPPGRGRRLRSGSDVTLVTWGNPVIQCESAADVLETNGFTVDLIDLRSLSPWDHELVIASAGRTGRLAVVHEDSLSGGFGAEVVATVAQHVDHRVQIRRITRPDTFVPFQYENQLEVLPSCKRIVETCADLLGCDIVWMRREEDALGEQVVRAIGTGPSDEMVDVVELFVGVGDRVESGDVVAEIEATKSAAEITATVAGTIVEVLATAGQRVPVGQPILRVRLDREVGVSRETVIKEVIGKALLTQRRHARSALSDRKRECVRRDVRECLTIYGSRPCTVVGEQVVTSESLAGKIPGWTSDMVRKRTGVLRRNWVSTDQTLVSMAVDVAEKLLSSLGSGAPPVGAVLCSVTCPQEASPSISCQVASRLRDSAHISEDYFAFDFNAACSGYLYGLKISKEILCGRQDMSVLLLTSEVGSLMLDPEDPVTAFLFGDAASATLISAVPSQHLPLSISAPVCMATPDPEVSIHLPCAGSGGFLTMDGIAVARAAYKGMAHAVRRALFEAGLSVESLGAFVPHPGSARILKNVAEELGLSPTKVLTTLRETGNTSSSSIPLSLDVFWDDVPRNRPFAMAAFGAGFTSAAAIGMHCEDTHD